MRTASLRILQARDGRDTECRIYSDRVRFRNGVRKALQNTGLQDFRQSQFVDTRYTLGYTSWFLTVTDVLVSGLCGAGLVMGRGGVAQLGERLNGIQEVSGSIPLASMAWHESWPDASSKWRVGRVAPEVCRRSQCIPVRSPDVSASESCVAGIAQLVEHNLAKVGVAGSSPVSRSHSRVEGGVGRGVCTAGFSNAGDVSPCRPLHPRFVRAVSSVG